jgi:hypothetical protein
MPRWRRPECEEQPARARACVPRRSSRHLDGSLSRLPHQSDAVGHSHQAAGPVVNHFSMDTRTPRSQAEEAGGNEGPQSFCSPQEERSRLRSTSTVIGAPSDVQLDARCADIRSQDEVPGGVPCDRRSCLGCVRRPGSSAVNGCVSDQTRSKAVNQRIDGRRTILAIPRADGTRHRLRCTAAGILSLATSSLARRSSRRPSPFTDRGS